MKRTLTINLNAIVFNIDEDAYEVLAKYLSDIAAHFSSEEEKNDIMADIEARIAELFTERLRQYKEVITIEDIHEIIAVMGKPNQFSDEGADAEEAPNSSNSEKKKRGKRRFYRDPENAVLGGVCAGLAAYFNFEITAVRIILVVFSLFGGGFITIPAYFLAWLIAPKAITASQRLEMQGEDVTVENIKAEFEHFKNYVESENFKTATKSAGQRLSGILGGIFKVFFIFIAAVLAFSAAISLIVTFALILAGIFLPLDSIIQYFIQYYSDYAIIHWESFSLELGILSAIALLIVVLCSIIMILYGLKRLFSNDKSKSPATFWVIFVIWLLGIFMFIVAITKTLWELTGNKEINRNFFDLNWYFNYEPTCKTYNEDTYNAIDASGYFTANPEELTEE